MADRGDTRRTAAVPLPGATIGPLWAVSRRIIAASVILLALVGIVLLDRDVASIDPPAT